MTRILRYLFIFLIFLISFLFYDNVNAFIGAPRGVKAISEDTSSIKISWEKIPDVKFYDIYIKESTGYKYISTVKASKPSYFIHDNLDTNKEYIYVLRSRNKDEESNYSVPVSLFIGDKYTNVKSLSIKNKESIPPGKSYFLNLDIEKDNNDLPLFDSTIKWTSSNKKIATVDENGMVNSFQEGIVTIKATAHNGADVSYKLKIESRYAKKIPILTFHRITSDNVKVKYFKNYQWVAAVSDFEKQMKYLKDNDYKTISVDEFKNWYDGNIEYPKKTILITFDDGDYEQYYLVLPILKKYNFKATSFIVGSRTKLTTFNFINNQKSNYIGLDKINEIGKKYPNFEFQSHSYDLHYRNAGKMPIEYFKDYYDLTSDFIKNKKFGFRYIAYPYGAYTKEMILAAKNNNIEMGFAFDKYVCAKRTSPRYVIPRIKINGQIKYEDYVKKLKSFLK